MEYRADGLHDPAAGRWMFQSGLLQIQFLIVEVGPKCPDRLWVGPHPLAAEIGPPSVHDGVRPRDQVHGVDPASTHAAS